MSPRLIVLPMGWNWRLVFCQAAVEGEVLAAGFENAPLVHDRQVVQKVDLSPVVATYVNNVAVIDENRLRVMDTTATVKNCLESDGLRCMGTGRTKRSSTFRSQLRCDDLALALALEKSRSSPARLNIT